jgi:hypothetical protein
LKIVERSEGRNGRKAWKERMEEKGGRKEGCFRVFLV